MAQDQSLINSPPNLVLFQKPIICNNHLAQEFNWSKAFDFMFLFEFSDIASFKTKIKLNCPDNWDQVQYYLQ